MRHSVAMAIDDNAADGNFNKDMVVKLFGFAYTMLASAGSQEVSKIAEKDITEKMLESHNDVFADIVNVLLFDGKEVIRPDELEEQAPRAAYEADGKIQELERDTVKRWKKHDIRIACIGLENQTTIDPDMPLRVIGYDGAEYRAQLNRNTKDDAGNPVRTEKYPVITLVLYFGYKQRWNKPVNLLSCFDVPEEFRPYINDYRINLFEIAYLDDETVKKFTSDFHVVADFFVQMQKNRDYKPEPWQIKHVQDILMFMSAVEHDSRYEDFNVDGEEGGAKEIMSEFLDMIENRGRAKGFEEGIEQGIAKGREEGLTEGLREGGQKESRRMAERMISGKKLSYEDIAEYTGLSMNEVRALAAGQPV